MIELWVKNNFMFYAPQQLLVGRSHEEGWDWQGMQHE
jgi:hypothetical protein